MKILSYKYLIYLKKLLRRKKKINDGSHQLQDLDPFQSKMDWKVSS
jgi:hypothetical protein